MMKMKIGYVYILSMMVLAVLAVSAVNAQMFEVNYTIPNNALNTPNLVVSVLKYEPYPVNAGDWFDVWIKVQNDGQADAKNVSFELKPEYPFSSNDSLIRNYGTILGTLNSYQTGMQGDANEVVLKYRVKTADNSPEGESGLKFGIADSTNNGVEFVQSLPIVIGKTKTDFDVVIQDATSSGLSFAISNSGSNDASAVTVTLEPAKSLFISGPQSSIIGNLAKGDFTTVTFQAMPGRNLSSVTLKLDYTDVVGIRNTVEKSVTLPQNMNYSANFSAGRTGANGLRTGSLTIPVYAYFIAGFVLGAVVAFGYNMLRKKR
jgi:hypothetical protein